MYNCAMQAKYLLQALEASGINPGIIGFFAILMLSFISYNMFLGSIQKTVKAASDVENYFKKIYIHTLVGLTKVYT